AHAARVRRRRVGARGQGERKSHRGARAALDHARARAASSRGPPGQVRGVRRHFLALALVALAPPALAASPVTDATFEATLSRRVVLPYRVWLPEGYAAKGKAWPAILFLHGSGERGNDLSFLARNGPPH